MDPYTGVKLSARSVTNWSRPPTRRIRRIFSDDPVGRAALVVDPTPTANANDTPAVDPTPTARRSSGHVAGLSDGAERGGEKRQGIAHKRVAAERQVSRNRSNREPHGCTRDRDGMPGRGKGLPGKSPGSTTPGRRGGI